jgi:RluA family pseudouridine synthase
MSEQNIQGIEIIHADEALLAVCKPAGIFSLPDRYDPTTPHLQSLLEPRFGRLWIVHRLDAETSGIVVLARNAESHQLLNDQFTNHTVAKTYHALVTGTPPQEHMTIDAPLRPDADSRHRTIIDRRKGKQAITECTVLETMGRFTLLEVCPHTGRTHQIRVHLASMGLAVVVDRLYGNPEPILLSGLKGSAYHGDRETERPLLTRLGLHAVSISLTHPLSHEQATYTAPYPRDFAATVKQLRKCSTIRSPRLISNKK